MPLSDHALTLMLFPPVAAGAHAPSSALPLGATRLTRDTELVEIDLTGPRASSEVLNRLLAVPQAEEGDEGEEKVVRGPVGGFVWVCVLSSLLPLVVLRTVSGDTDFANPTPTGLRSIKQRRRLLSCHLCLVDYLARLSFSDL